MDILKRLGALPESERVTFATNYREQVLRALGIAQSYDGSEGKYRELTTTLISLETWINNTLKITPEKTAFHLNDHKLNSDILDGKHRMALDLISLLAKFQQRLCELVFIDKAQLGIGSREQKKPTPEVTNEELKTAILEQVPTAEEWAGMTAKDKSGFKVAGMGLVAIASRFGVEGSPVGNRKFHLELGYKIYGRCEILEAKETFLNGLKAEVIKKIPTAEEWAGMKHREKGKFKIEKMGLGTIATKFGIGGDPIRNHKFHLELGQKIYGECEELFYEEKPELIGEQLKAAILAQIPTAKEWAGMGQEERLAFKVAGMGLTAIARRFGVEEGNPIGYYKVHLELGQKIYGECEELFYEEKPELIGEQLKAAILAQIPTAKEWAGMGVKEKDVFEVAGLSPYRIATKFGVDGDPRKNRKYHLELGRKIYGECEELEYEEKPEITDEQLKVAVLEQVPTAEEWAGMGDKEKRALKVAGMGLRAITTRFGVEGEPFKHSVYLELGRKIYGEGPAFEK